MASHDITSLDQLRALYREPSERVRRKKGTVIEGAAVDFVATSTFACLATADADGNCDVSPRGGPAGQVKVLAGGTRVVLPDLSGNNLIDSLTNIVSNPRAGLLVMIPGSDETLRIDGRAHLTTDPDILGLWDTELRTPRVAVVIEIDAVFLHCAKAFRRGGVWRPEAWPALTETAACEMFNDIAGTDTPPAEMRRYLEESYAGDLEAERVTSNR
jgi:PPOX class probable FMN-dependent enzyme